MTATFLPPPPEPAFSTAKRLEVYEQMLSDLENQAAYQQEAIAFHTQSLESIKAESEITAQELESCRGIIKSLKASTTIAQAVEARGNEGHSQEEEETKAPANSQPESKAKAKSKPAASKSKSKSSRKTSVNPTAPKTELKAISSEPTEAKSKTKSEVKTVAKPVSTLPASEVIDKFESITAMVLDFVKKQEGVISVIDLIKYAYPKGLKTEAETKKVSSSFSSVLINQTKKGILERTVPGKYMWAKNTVS
ncbi:MAG: hypothetical protein HC930_12040 [Hydrococcus sp. SU_1_0]|nr:hypothetical protein [Hydrococcus sp. SU_1_0]